MNKNNEVDTKKLTPLESELKYYLSSKNSKWSFATKDAFIAGWSAGLNFASHYELNLVIQYERSSLKMNQ